MGDPTVVTGHIWGEKLFRVSPIVPCPRYVASSTAVDNNDDDDNDDGGIRFMDFRDREEEDRVVFRGREREEEEEEEDVTATV
jgi:hypothetical protein